MQDLRRISSTWRAAVGARLFATGLAVAGLLGSAPARAANVTINTTNITGGNLGTTAAPRASMYQFYISYQDCLDGTWKITLPVTVASGVTGTLQLWASETVDCSVDAARGGTTGGCVPITTTSTAQGYTVTAAQIMSALTTVKSCVDTTQSSAVRTVTLYFVLVSSTETNAGTVDATNVGSYPVSVELTGPAAPTGVSLGVGDSLLILNLPAIAVDLNTQGYYIFCDPNPTPLAAASDAGACFDAGGSSSGGGAGGAGGAATSSSSSGGGGGGASSSSAASSSSSAASSSSSSAASSSSSSASSSSGTTTTTSTTAGAGGASATDCPASTTIPCLDPAHPTIDAASLCEGPIAATSTAPVITGLTNGKTYAIGIAAYDNVGNIGPLASLQCAQPQPTDGFFGQYCADGGNGCGGCGSCVVGAGGDLTWPGLTAAALAAVGLLVRRDERRRQKARSRKVAETE